METEHLEQFLTKWFVLLYAYLCKHASLDSLCAETRSCK